MSPILAHLSDEPFVGLKREQGLTANPGAGSFGTPTLSDEPFVGLKREPMKADRPGSRAFRRTLCGVEASV